MAKPELGTKRLCPNCGAKYYDLNRDPIMCPKCNAAFATGIVAARPDNDDDDELDADDEGVELVALETAEASDDDNGQDIAVAGADDDDDDSVDVVADDDALIEDHDDEVSDVVRPTESDEEEN